MARLTQDEIKNMMPERRKALEKRRKKVERNRKILGAFICVTLVVVTSLILSLTVLFKIDTIKVLGDSIYDEKQIINASGVSKGENLFLCDLQKASDGICKNLPYISKAEVRRELPSSIIFEITPAEAYIAVKTKSGMALADKDGKVLEIVASDKVPKKSIKLNSDIVFSASAGDNIFTLDEKNSENEKSKNIELLKKIFDAIENSKLKDVTEIDIKSSVNIYITYQNRLKLNIGSADEIDYKLKSAVEIIKKEDEISPKEKGEIFLANTDNIYVSPDKN